MLLAGRRPGSYTPYACFFALATFRLWFASSIAATGCYGWAGCVLASYCCRAETLQVGRQHCRRRLPQRWCRCSKPADSVWMRRQLFGRQLLQHCERAGS